MNRSARLAIMLVAASSPLLSLASSHREAPLIAGSPRVDGTDLYLFRSYEAGRDAYVTVIANYLPFQDPNGGPNFYQLDSQAVYAININNDGDAKPDISFKFRFRNERKNLAVSAGGQNVPVPLLNIGPVDKNGKTLNVEESYTVTVARIKGSGSQSLAENATLGGTRFWKPVDNIGKKSIPDYAAYAVTSLALEVPIKCLTNGKDPVIAAWTTASVPNAAPRANDSADQSEAESSRAAWTQVSRLANPLVNEVVIGLPDKDKFNGSDPLNDTQVLKYVTNPTLPVLLNVLFGNAAKVPGTPRNDLVAAFLTGVKGLNQPVTVRPAELMRLNTSTAPTPPAMQNDLGVLGGDLAGFPNGRRPFDDVADIELRVLEGALCGKIGSCGSQTTDPNNGAPYTDGARAAGPDAASVKISGAVNPADTYLDVFPYLNTALPGSPNGVAD
jgi:hypothetical protein